MKSTTHNRRLVNDPTYEEGYNDIREFSSFVYSYYPDGNVKTVSDTRGSTTYDTIYGYDAANRLTIANTTNNGARVRTWGYNYNNRGDRISQTVTDAENVSTATVYTYTNHRLTSENTAGNVTEYRYDANGNTIAKLNDSVTYQYTYTPRNEVASVTTQSGTYTYTYNASSLRTSKTSNGVTTSFIWAGDNIIREETPDKSTDYFYGINRVSRTVKGNAYTYNAVIDSYYDETLEDYVETVVPVNGYHEFYAYDGRGNVVHTMALDSIDLYLGPFYGSAAPFPEMDLNCDGEFDLMDLNTASVKYPIVQNYYYSPFGEIWQGERSTDTNPFRYAGEYLDNETGDIYLRARYYDPSIGRFISVDPIKDGTNWYVYCSNNPIAFVDPSGLESYIFYLVGWEDRAHAAASELASMGVNPKDITFVPLSSEEDFENGWNCMGTGLDSNGNNTSDGIDHIIIDTHGSYKEFGTNDDWTISLNEIDNLEEKDVKGNVVLLGCNNGHLDHKDDNVASHFAKKVNGALVIASDGTVDVNIPNNKNDEHTKFTHKGITVPTPNGYYKSKYLKKRGGYIDPFEKQLKYGMRDNQGWVVYRYSGNTVSARVTGNPSKNLTISGACQLNY
ncbi:MAG: hypothetical protein IJ435_07555 [Clostridia bacterium]|nr:hypothetical protein [Clostridia bacterium]